mmetsp:Transcript_30595/g.71324  ORF Transcript_30595/g.71324 Transcript_30595/m.71324 type:complete len:159 (+) Transcript_30595:119-595(+)
MEDDEDEADDEPTVALWAQRVAAFVQVTPAPFSSRAGGAPVFRAKPRRIFPATDAGLLLHRRKLEARFELPSGRISYMAGGQDVLQRVQRRKSPSAPSTGSRRRSQTEPEAARMPAHKKRRTEGNGAAGASLAEKYGPFVQRPSIVLSQEYEDAKSAL